MNLCPAVASSPLGSVRDGAKDVSCPQEGGRLMVSEGGRLMVSEAVGSSSTPASASSGAATSLIACAMSKRRSFARSLDVYMDEAGGGDEGRGTEGSLDVYMDASGGGDAGGGAEASCWGADLGKAPLGRSHRTSPVELW